MLAGVPLGPCSLRKELSEGDKFVPPAYLDKVTSILGSLSAPITTVQQFSLPKDDDGTEEEHAAVQEAVTPSQEALMGGDN
ncbi:uncharacterized protein A4U43_C06F19580 [Asparagus officinalis]|uniref:Uncharacterized protein n=1 Tax=Asparagus officinalis TaxID=4686 RepID=A0A5P1ES38_ASPOF|nr:uncharacterized protein A4U43_C06F19580 [Asparagus officinalis]